MRGDGVLLGFGLFHVSLITNSTCVTIRLPMSGQISKRARAIMGAIHRRPRGEGQRARLSLHWQMEGREQFCRNRTHLRDPGISLQGGGADTCMQCQADNRVPNWGAAAFASRALPRLMAGRLESMTASEAERRRSTQPGIRGGPEFQMSGKGVGEPELEFEIREMGGEGELEAGSSRVLNAGSASLGVWWARGEMRGARRPAADPFGAQVNSDADMDGRRRVRRRRFGTGASTGGSPGTGWLGNDSGCGKGDEASSCILYVAVERGSSGRPSAQASSCRTVRRRGACRCSLAGRCMPAPQAVVCVATQKFITRWLRQASVERSRRGHALGG